MIKGKSKICLYDAKTGEQTLCAEDSNMITKAVERLLNPPVYWGFNSKYSDMAQAIDLLTPISTKMLGGIMLWADNIVEDENLIMPPNDNVIVGHAGSGYSGSTQTRGSYNLNESGEIFDENGNSTGYRHVWDFATDKANGTINCITLTSRGGGNSGYPPVADGSGLFSYPSDFDGDEKNITVDRHIVPFNYSALEPSNTLHPLLKGRRSDGSVLVINTEKRIAYLLNGQSSSTLTLNQDLSGIDDNNQQNTIISSFSGSTLISSGCMTDDDTYVYFGGLSQQEITLYLCDVHTGEIKDTLLLSLSSTDYTFISDATEIVGITSYAAAGARVALLNGYYYISNGFHLYKFSKNGAFIKRVTQTPLPNRFNISVVNGKLYLSQYATSSSGFCYVVDENDSVVESGLVASNKCMPVAVYDAKSHLPYFLVDGRASTISYADGGVTEQMIFRPYIASINNLDVPITKTTAQTMKIIYEIYQD